jgi:hypothetical protein
VTIKLTQWVYGQAPGSNYTGPEEAWLVANGYGYVENEKAKVTGSANAVNIVTGGNLVLKVNGVTVTTALAAADTPAAAATKIDTALGANGDAAIVSSKLEVTSNGTADPPRTVEVVSGTGTVLANLGLTVGQKATTDKSNASGALPDDDPQLKTNREDPGDAYQFGTDTELAPRLEDVDTVNPDLSADALPAAGGTALVVYGDNFTGATGVTFGGTSGTSFSVVDDNTIHVTSPAKAAGAYAVVVTKGVGNSNSLAAGVTYV